MLHFVQSPLAQAFGKLMQAENDLGHRLSVSGSQSFHTSIVFLGDRRGQVDCFVQLSNQFVQIQLQIEFSWSRCQPFGPSQPFRSR
jgi:hypothetical protein